VKRGGLLLQAALLAGCTAVGPDYSPPQIAVPGQFAEADASAAAGDGQLASWWSGFDDPALTRLVELALVQNLDVEAATARIAESRALERAAGAAALPQVSAQASASRQRISENAIPVPPGSGGSQGGAFGLPGSEFNTFRVGFDAAWELDLFGRTQRSIEAASARSGAAVWNRRDVESSVAAEVAASYLRLRTLQQRIAIAEAEAARQQRLEQLVSAQAKGGLVDGQAVERQRSATSAASAAIAPIQAQAKAEIHALGLLAGTTPEALGWLSEPQAIPSPPGVPAGLPSDLLRRRPDIRAAERELAAATADIGVATADLFPRISLTAAPALVSTALASLIEWGSRSFTVGAALDWPIFDGGRRRATVEAKDARQQQAMIAYRKAVLTALKDVEDALARIEAGREQLAGLQSALASAERNEQLAGTRFRGGLVTYADVLAARAQVLSLKSQVTETRGALGRDTIALAKALGGGWPELADLGAQQ
jgi:NodT family efflux transporter outer membrane factor (OMF) lipoprotein